MDKVKFEAIDEALNDHLVVSILKGARHDEFIQQQRIFLNAPVYDPQFGMPLSLPDIFVKNLGNNIDNNEGYLGDIARIYYYDDKFTIPELIDMQNDALDTIFRNYLRDVHQISGSRATEIISQIKLDAKQIALKMKEKEKIFGQLPEPEEMSKIWEEFDVLLENKKVVI